MLSGVTVRQYVRIADEMGKKKKKKPYKKFLLISATAVRFERTIFSAEN